MQAAMFTSSTTYCAVYVHHIDLAKVWFLSDSDTSVDIDFLKKEFIKDCHVGCKEPFFLLP